MTTANEMNETIKKAARKEYLGVILASLAFFLGFLFWPTLYVWSGADDNIFNSLQDYNLATNIICYTTFLCTGITFCGLTATIYGRD